MKIINKCLFCGEDFETETHRVKRGEGKYCSHSCSFKMNHKIKPITGKSNPNWKGNLTKCKGCKKYFHIPKCQEKFIKYCSKECRSKHRISPLNYLIRSSKDYKQWRTKVFERDNYTCQECGKKGNLQVHHIKKFSKFKEHRFDLTNGLTLCLDCHKLTDNFCNKN